jgi:hypothetical protein
MERREQDDAQGRARAEGDGEQASGRAQAVGHGGAEIWTHLSSPV